MSGQKKFMIFRPILLIVGQALSLLPKSMRKFIWSIVAPFSGPISLAIRYMILFAECRVIGDNVYIGEFVIIKNAERLQLGSNVAINAFCYIESLGGCKIGNNVAIAHNVSILTSNHSWEDESSPINYNKLRCEPVEIQDDVWIGCGVRIMAGVRIGKRSVVAAGSVVTKDVPSRTVVAGVPAKVIKELIHGGGHAQI